MNLYRLADKVRVRVSFPMALKTTANYREQQTFRIAKPYRISVECVWSQ